MLETVDLSKRYPDGKLALDALNLEVGAGQIFCLLGAHGAGKTTVINLFLRFTEPTSGKARICGIDVAEDAVDARRHTGYLGSPSELYPRLTARQNLAFLAQVAGRGDCGREDLYMAMRQVGLPERCFEQRASELTPGLRQKVALAAVLLKDAPALLLDEPLAGLDLKEAAECAEVLAGLRAGGKAILLATHDIFWAKQLADRVAILKEGRQVLARSPSELRYENLEKLYLDYMRGSLGP